MSARISAVSRDGSAWDFPGGAPDPYVKFDGTAVTQIAADTLYPSWIGGRTYSLSSLQGGVIISVWDSDVTSDDLISGGRLLTVREADLVAGSITWSGWEYVDSITFTLRKPFP